MVRQRNRTIAYLVGDLKLLSLADVFRLGNSSFESLQSLVVQLLHAISSLHIRDPNMTTHRSTRDG